MPYKAYKEYNLSLLRYTNIMRLANCKHSCDKLFATHNLSDLPYFVFPPLLSLLLSVSLSSSPKEGPSASDPRPIRQIRHVHLRHAWLGHVESSVHDVEASV